MNTMIKENSANKKLNISKEMIQILGISEDEHEALRGRAQFYLDGGHDERALIMLEMLEELDKRDETATLLAIDVLLRLGRSSDADKKAQYLIRKNPKSLDGQLALAQISLAKAEFFEAANYLEKVIQNAPSPDSDAAKRAYLLARDAQSLFVG